MLIGLSSQCGGGARPRRGHPPPYVAAGPPPPVAGERSHPAPPPVPPLGGIFFSRNPPAGGGVSVGGWFFFRQAPPMTEAMVVSTPEYANDYMHVAMHRADGVLELRIHSDGESLVWGAGPHSELGRCFQVVGSDPENR